MKIFIISRGLPEEGSGLFEFDQAKALAEYGHDVTFIALDLRSIRHKRKLGIKNFKKYGMNIVKASIPLGAINKKLFYFIGERVLRMALKSAIEYCGKCSIIHAHFLENGYMALKAGKRVCPDIPIIVTEHSSTINKPIQEIDNNEKRIAYYTYSNVACLIAVSESLAKQIKANFNVNSRVVYNIIDLSLFKKSYISSNEKRDIDFISVGNLIINKRMDLLIHCFCKAFGSNDNRRLVICGNGPEYNNLKKLVRDYNAEGNVILTGRKTRTEIAEYLSRSKAFILLSERETFGVAFIEAMAAGLPVISTKSGGPECFITDNVGVLVEEDEECIVESMRVMLEDKEKYDRGSIAQYANDNFGPNVIAEELTIVYKEMIGKFGVEHDEAR